MRTSSCPLARCLSLTHVMYRLGDTFASPPWVRSKPASSFFQTDFFHEMGLGMWRPPSCGM